MQYILLLSLYIFGFYFFLLAIKYLILFLQLRKLVLQYPRYNLETIELIPSYIKKLYAIPVKNLEQLGFKQYEYLQVEPMIRLDPLVEWAVLLFNEEFQTYALVGINYFAPSINIFDICFYNFFTNDSLLLTMNGKAHGIIGQMPNFIIQDVYTAEVASQWQTHRDKITQLQSNSYILQDLSSEKFVFSLQEYSRKYLDYLIKQNKIKPLKNKDLLQISLLSAIQATHKEISNAGKVIKMLRQKQINMASNANVEIEIPPEIEVNAFERMEKLQQGLIGKKARTWLLFISLGLFAISLTQQIEPISLAVFLGAIIFHELGHILAMKFFGYQNTAILFIPFLGALATARKDDASLTQKFWVSLMGPLPGLILGIVLAIYSSSNSALNEASWILIGLNLFNLLPVYPLDGGQIADLLLFSTFPYVGVLFKLLGVLVLALLGLFGNPMLFIFAMLIAIGIPDSFHSAKIHRQLRLQLKQNNCQDRKSILYTIFQHLNQSKYINKPFARKYNLANVWLHQHRNLNTKLSTKLFLILIYVVTLLGSIVGSVHAFIPSGIGATRYWFESDRETITRLKKEKQKELKNASQKILENPNDIEAYLIRANAHRFFEDLEGELEDYNQIIRLEPNNTHNHFIRANLLIRLGNELAAIEDYSKILKRDNRNQAAYYRRASIFEQLEEYDKAVADYDRLIQLNPQHYSAYIARGNVHLKLNNERDAIKDASIALKLYPEEPEGYELRAAARRKLGDNAGATSDEQKADEIYQTY